MYSQYGQKSCYYPCLAVRQLSTLNHCSNCILHYEPRHRLTYFGRHQCAKLNLLQKLELKVAPPACLLRAVNYSTSSIMFFCYVLCPKQDLHHLFLKCAGAYSICSSIQNVFYALKLPSRGISGLATLQHGVSYVERIETNDRSKADFTIVRTRRAPADAPARCRVCSVH
jgi:hypothetical protein